MVSEVFKKIDELEKEYISVWEDVGNLESPTNDKEGVDAVGNYFSKMAEERGFEIEKFENEVGDVVCITMNPESDLAPLCISGHIDTVHPRGVFGYPPVRIDEEKIYGPGVQDCKGGVVAGFLAMDALFQCGFKKRPVRLLLQVDEEGGSAKSGKKTIRYICEKAKDAIGFLNLEGYTPGQTTLKRKGVATFRFDVTGIEGHSSRCATEGASAILDAAHKIIELEKFKDDSGITCNCGVISGGSVVNTIPGKCTFFANFRYAENNQLEYLTDFVKKLAENPAVEGTTCEVTQTGMRVAMEHTERNFKLLDKVNDIFVKYDMPQLKPATFRGGSDGADVTSYGIPCLDSLGTRGSKTHNVGEFSYLASLTESAKRIAVIACEIE